MILAWLSQFVAQRFIRWWCSKHEINKEDAWIASRSINMMESIMCWVVLILILWKFNLHFKVETNEVYDVAGETPLGYRYNLLNAAGDYCVSTYLIVFIVKAAYLIPFWGDFVHRGCALLTIWLLRNAVEYEYAPSLLCFFAACMLLHSAASG